jgi:hypothetical protein
MNLNNNPTKQDLQAIFSAANDNQTHHILWVDAAGEVRVTPSPEDINPAGWESKFPSTRLRYETFEVGAGYVGPEAAQDQEHVDRLYRSLLAEWSQHSNSSSAEYIDIF